ncbi:DUF317 domain-containing protein [Streptomyces acidicola]|uniref:DUF317 domain-containing protein n=1 Tax=Streptomyces acidicola TaxID=2596892 RepID=UPI001D14D443|nr:DUF317 domain-containing protein [Streptomyces acidicola]
MTGRHEQGLSPCPLASSSSTGTSARSSLLYVSPDVLCGAEWILSAYPFELGGLPVTRQLSARSHVTSVMAEWNAYFTTGVPYEALADLLMPIGACEEPGAGLAGAGDGPWRHHCPGLDPRGGPPRSGRSVPLTLQDGLRLLRH